MVVSCTVQAGATEITVTSVATSGSVLIYDNADIGGGVSGDVFQVNAGANAFTRNGGVVNTGATGQINLVQTAPPGDAITGLAAPTSLPPPAAFDLQHTFRFNTNASATIVFFTLTSLGVQLPCTLTAADCAPGQTFDAANCECDDVDVVSLLELTATREGDAVRLRWVTGSEVGCGSFEVHRCALERGACAAADHAPVAGASAQPCRGGTGGATYDLVDPRAAFDAGWSHLLREHETSGAVREYGPLRLPAGATAATWDPERDPAGGAAWTPPVEARDAGGGCAATGGASATATLLAAAALAVHRRHRRGRAR